MDVLLPNINFVENMVNYHHYTTVHYQFCVRLSEKERKERKGTFNWSKYIYNVTKDLYFFN